MSNNRFVWDKDQIEIKTKKELKNEKLKESIFKKIFKRRKK